MSGFDAADDAAVFFSIKAALPDQPSVFNIILGSEVNDHRGAKLVDALENRVIAALQDNMFCFVFTIYVFYKLLLTCTVSYLAGFSFPFLRTVFGKFLIQFHVDVFIICQE